MSLLQVLSDIAKLQYQGFDCSDSDIIPYFQNPQAFRRIVSENNLTFVSAWSTLVPKNRQLSHRRIDSILVFR
jgi:sugar phosphate isomerase/epimerase